MGRISGQRLLRWWYNPWTGESEPIGEIDNTGIVHFDPPVKVEAGNDWLLVLDDASRNCGAPGR